MYRTSKTEEGGAQSCLAFFEYCTLFRRERTGDILLGKDDSTIEVESCIQNLLRKIKVMMINGYQKERVKQSAKTGNL